MRPLLLTLLLALQLHGLGQVFLHYDRRELAPAAMRLEYILDSATELSDAVLLQKMQQPWLGMKDHLPQVSYSPFHAWIRIPLAHLRSQGPVDWLDLTNPHLNRLQAWIVNDTGIVRSYGLTGDALPFASRPLPSRSFLFPLSESEQRSRYLVIAVEKRHSKMVVPIHFKSQAYFVDSFDFDLKAIALFFGFALFLFIFNGYQFLTTRQPAYGWYLAYLALVCLYICTDSGLLFKWVTPNHPMINDIIRPASFALSIVPMVLFFNHLLAIRSTAPSIHRFNTWMLAVYVLLFLMAVGSSAITQDPVLQKKWIEVNRIVTPLVILLLIGESLFFVRRKNIIALFSFGSFSMLIVFSFIYIGSQTGALPRNLFTDYALYWGLSLDAIIMALSLAWRYTLFRRHMEQLAREKSDLQEKIFQEIANWQEKERQRFSELLHDHIGASIGLLRLQVDNMPLEEGARQQLGQEISGLGHQVRSISHTLSPLPLQNKGLYQAVGDVVQAINQSSELHLHYEWMGKKKIEDEKMEMIIYRIVQEITHNLIRHSKCKTATLQLMNGDHQISIYMEDDGVGSETVQAKKGIGLQSIEKIVHLLKGRMQIVTRKNKGFSISIEIDTESHETNPDRHSR